MRVIIQRVTEASVTVESEVKGKIGQGLLILVGFEACDNTEDIGWMCGKIARLRIFGDNEGVMNLSVCDIQGSILVVSQFTLHALTKKGNRPSYIKAAPPTKAQTLYSAFVNTLKTEPGLKIETGVFGAMMQVKLNNDGPVTIFIDSKRRE